MKVIIFITIIVLSGIPMWLTGYPKHVRMVTGASVLICALSAAILAYSTTHKKRKIILYVTGAQLIGHLIKVYIDCIPDPTNHNLVPFEIMFLLIIDAIAFTIAVLIGSGIKKLVQYSKIDVNTKRII